MEKRVIFSSKLLPYFLVAPQMIIVFIFFFWPASQAIILSFFREDPFGLSSRFVGLANFSAIFTSKIYLNSISVTLLFSLCVTFFAMSTSLFLAVLADRVIRGGAIYKTMVIWPYAVAPIVAGVLWMFMFNSFEIYQGARIIQLKFSHLIMILLSTTVPDIPPWLILAHPIVFCALFNSNRYMLSNISISSV